MIGDEYILGCGAGVVEEKEEGGAFCKDVGVLPDEGVLSFGYVVVYARWAVHNANAIYSQFLQRVDIHLGVFLDVGIS